MPFEHDWTLSHQNRSPESNILQLSRNKIFHWRVPFPQNTGSRNLEFCAFTINRRGNWYRYANHCSVRFYIIILAKSRQENSSRDARYWLPRSKECADLHDVSSSFVRELKRNNKQTNKLF